MFQKNTQKETSIISYIFRWIHILFFKKISGQKWRAEKKCKIFRSDEIF